MNNTTSLTEVSYIERHWEFLQPHVREAIMTLVDGALTGLVERQHVAIETATGSTIDPVGASCVHE